MAYDGDHAGAMLLLSLLLRHSAKNAIARKGAWLLHPTGGKVPPIARNSREVTFTSETPGSVGG